MPEECTTPGVVERWRCSFQALNSGDIDAALSIWGPDPVFDVSPMGLGTYEGLARIRAFWEGWLGTFEQYEIEPEQILDLGNGVTLAAVTQKGHPGGSRGEVRLRYAAVAVWASGMVVRVTNYTDIDEAHSAAERLAAERE